MFQRASFGPGADPQFPRDRRTCCAGEAGARRGGAMGASAFGIRRLLIARKHLAKKQGMVRQLLPSVHLLGWVPTPNFSGSAGNGLRGEVSAGPGAGGVEGTRAS